MIANRVQCENKRLHLEQWLKRGIVERSTGPHNSKTKKDEANTNTLTRCRSLELLDGADDILSDRIKSSTPQFSRSIDFLDSQDHLPERHNRNPDYSDHFESSNNSNIKNHSEIDEPNRRTPLRKFDAEHLNGSKRSSSISHSGRESYCYSDKDNDREKQPQQQQHVIYQDRVPSSAYGGNSSKEDRKVSSSAGSSSYDHRNEKIKVTERLEELLSKTKKILELEKITKKKHTDNRYILALDRLKDIHHYESNPQQVYHAQTTSSKRGDPSANHLNGTAYDIAQEMEKITQSLLPAVPVSPEISKDITTRKERSLSSQNSSHRNASGLMLGINGGGGSSTPHSTMSPSSSLLGGRVQKVVGSLDDGHDHHMASTNFMEMVSVRGEEEDSELEMHVHDSVNVPMVNGFYANNCFEDLPSSSNTTIKSAPNHSRKKAVKEEESEEEGEEVDEDEEEEEEDDDEQDKDWESDDQCDLSDMANLTQLKELKSRILNGTNWRSQVLQKSVHDLFQKANENGEPVEGGTQEDLASAEDSDQNRVRYIISKLQNTTIQQVEPPQVHSELDQGDNYSDSSEEEDDLDCVDGPPPQDDRPVTAKSLIEMYEKALPKVENQPPVAAIRQQLFIPKDAYFHELPNKPKPPLKPPDLTSHLSQPVLPEPMPLTAHARSRNPLPSYLNDNEIFTQSPYPPTHFDSRVNPNHQSTPALYYPSHSPQFLNGNDPYLIPPSSYHHHSHYIPPQPPLQEKLLSSRKYINPSSYAISGGSTGTPSPEFPYQLTPNSQPVHHHHLQAPPFHQQFRKSQDNLSNDDSGYISAKVSEIAANSGGIGPVAGGSPHPQVDVVVPMPRQFIPYHLSNGGAPQANGMQHGASTAGMYGGNDDQVYNLGASSLV
ncbi:conserved hypothetical protein [Culex quinquefasciatus]|uniref:Uncharacterized protein n=1 Tax=Culex quinquefasciatus TaxID=7176 RepID=B0WGV7_CULQU|nr:conserved hypothetical protein [Culex quinquefasciatus]|eukprot:XP_001847941.1 conserved hypothetical protein [Culex quinquefasciatus]